VLNTKIQDCLTFRASSAPLLTQHTKRLQDAIKDKKTWGTDQYNAFADWQAAVTRDEAILVALEYQDWETTGASSTVAEISEAGERMNRQAEIRSLMPPPPTLPPRSGGSNA
jgi:ABC-type uncharacterized transport system YnjBCD substrate-binding protein